MTKGKFTKWPSITDLFPWQSNGVKAGRTWVIGPSMVNLQEKLTALIKADKKHKIELFKNSPTGRKFNGVANQLPPKQVVLPSLDKVHSNKEIDTIRYAYRSFDRQFIIADARFLDRPGPSLWQSRGERQIYITSLFSISLDAGPALVACSEIPDLDCFRGSYGAKAVLPLYRDAAAALPNILPGMLDILTKAYGRSVTPEDFAGYVYAILAQPEYMRRFTDELAGKEVRVPLTKDKKLFTKASDFGRELIWLHTYGERLHSAGHPAGQIPKGKAQCAKAVSDEENKYPNKYQYEENSRKLHVGDGVFAPVPIEVWEFEVSGLKVVQSWLGYRMMDRSGKKSSPLDDIRPRAWTREFTRELLELLWVLERTTDGYPKQKQLLDNVLASELFSASELPVVPDDAREAPKVIRSHGDQQRLLMDEE
jgi:predicted helicase